MSRSRNDRSTWLGVLVAFSGVAGGLLLDGGGLHQVLQPTAALIVLGGTLGAVLIQFPAETMLAAAHQLHHSFLVPVEGCSDLVDQAVACCAQVRRHGILSLDPQLEGIQDSFLRRALTLAVDGFTLSQIQHLVEVELSRIEDHEDCGPRVLEAAGGFAPTLGIVGAVIGLIQVMQHMDNLGEIGRGIAASFVSTLYGIALANLLFLPLAGKLRIRARERQMLREIAQESVVAIVEGCSSLALRQKLDRYVVQYRKEARQVHPPEITLS